MKPSAYTLSQPHTHESLTIWFICAPNHADTSRYLGLQEALAAQKIVIPETGVVGELFVENLSEDRDVYIQSGELLRGGRQDRAVGVDFVVPAKSKTRFPTFCVEHGRWHRRGPERADSFSTSHHYLASKQLKLAAKLTMSQHAVWNQVANMQEKLACCLRAPVQDGISPTSLELTLDYPHVRPHLQQYIEKLQPLLAQYPDALGFAFAINGRLNSAELYPSHSLFAKFWDKLLESAAVEALAECGGKRERPDTITADVVQTFLADADHAPVQSRPVTDRITLHTKRTPRTVLFETEDHALPGVPLHQHYIWYPE